MVSKVFLIFYYLRFFVFVIQEVFLSFILKVEVIVGRYCLGWLGYLVVEGEFFLFIIKNEDEMFQDLQVSC